jgi:hypothetical protein
LLLADNLILEGFYSWLNVAKCRFFGKVNGGDFGNMPMRSAVPKNGISLMKGKQSTFIEHLGNPSYN